MTAPEKLAYVSSELEKKGFDRLPAISLSGSPRATPVTVLTNCCIYPFDMSLHARTKTKTYYRPTGTQHLVNVTAAVAIELIESGQRVIIHLPDGAEERTMRLFKLHPRSELCTFVRGSIYEYSFIETLYGVLAKMEQVSRVDFCLYDSYASGLTKPFLPMFEDDPAVAARLAAQRTHFLYNLSMMAYDLLVRHGQAELRLVCPTALATKRPSSHLFTDTIHKAISNVLLSTLSLEMKYYTDKPVRIVEVAPGIVDSGLYDDIAVREATYQESVMDGFPIETGYENVHTWPMLRVSDLAEVCTTYLMSDTDEEIKARISPAIVELTLAGRNREEFTRHLSVITHEQEGVHHISRLLPEYCYAPGTVWNGLPDIRNGYTPIMLTPLGQRF